jgi:hypothetical protein
LAVLAEQTEISLIHLALAFVIQHPAVTAPIIGPRTMQHLESQLGAVDVTLSTDVLDRIDEIVPPGVTLSRSDAGYLPPHYQIRSCAAAAPPESCHVQKLDALDDSALSEAQKPDIADTEDARRCLLFRAPDPRDVRARHCGVEPTGVTIGENQVGHQDSGGRPAGHGATRPEVSVIRMSNSHQRTLDAVIRQNIHGITPSKGLSSR